MRSVRTEETESLLGGFCERQSAGLCGVRVFRPLASESETLDWSRKERARVVSCAVQHVETSGLRAGRVRLRALTYGLVSREVSVLCVYR